jgi:hypothetical protein
MTYPPCCQQYPSDRELREHRVPFFVFALHCEDLLELEEDLRVLGFGIFRSEQVPQVPPALQRLQ